MKIWTITTDDHNGTQTVVHFTEAAADAAALAFCREHWPKDAGPMPEDFTAAYDLIQAGDSGLIWIEEHDISDHPAIGAAIEATALAETVIGKLAKGDLNLHTDQGAIMDAYDAVADGNCILRGKMAADDTTVGLSPNLQAELERQEAAYIAAARAYATDDLEFDDQPAVAIGDDDGAFVSCWKWITTAEAGLVGPDS